MGTMIDTEADALLIKVLKGEAERLTEKDESTLTEHREAVIQRLNAIFSKEIPLLLQGEKCLDAGPLYWGLALAGFLKVSEISQCVLPSTLWFYFIRTGNPHISR